MDLSEEAVNSLDRGVGKLAALGGAVKTPRFTNLCVHKVGDVLRVSKVHEGITNVQLCAEVDTQVAEVEVCEGAFVEVTKASSMMTELRNSARRKSVPRVSAQYTSKHLNRPQGAQTLTKLVMCPAMGE